jgi:hypothetical protein
MFKTQKKGTRMTRIKQISTDFLFSELKSVQNPLNPCHPWLIDNLAKS